MRSTTVKRAILATLAAWLATRAAGMHANAIASPSAAQNAANHYPFPALFIENAGQLSKDIRYYLWGGQFSAFFLDRSVRYVLRTKTGTAEVLTLNFADANMAEPPVADHPTRSLINQLIGDPSTWRTGLRTSDRLVYRNVWPGLDVEFHIAAGQLEYEFHVAPGADVRAIRLSYTGTHSIQRDAQGNLELATAAGTIRDERPTARQIVDGRPVEIDSRFVVENSAAGSFRLVTGPYDHARPLTIDPGIVYSTFIGGGNSDATIAVAIDSTGSAYLAGWSQSLDYPTTDGTTASQGRASFVSKFSSDGSTLLYSTIIPADTAYSIAVDAAGNAYVTGAATPSSLSPTKSFATANVRSAYVAKLDPNGIPVYRVAVGGSVDNQGLAICLDAAGAAYVVGYTQGTDFPTTAGAFDRTYGGGVDDAFIFKLDASGTNLAYSTLVGGSGEDIARAIAVDSSGAAFIAGQTTSANFQTTSGAYQAHLSGTEDFFIAKVSASGSALLYSTLLGNTSGQGAQAYPTGIAVDNSGDAWFSGLTSDLQYPVTDNAAQTTAPSKASTVGVVTAINANGSGLLYSSYLTGFTPAFTGGVTSYLLGLTLDSTKTHAYVIGSTTATDYPTTPGAYGPIDTSQGGSVLSVIDMDSGALTYSSYIPFIFSTGTTIAVDNRGDVFLPTEALTATPATPGSYSTTVDGIGDAGVAKFAPRIDLAFNRPAQASSIFDGTLTPDRAVDGRFTTRWSSQFSDPQWLMVDLGTVSTIDRVVLHWETAYGASYAVQASNDGTTWTTIADVASGDGGLDDLTDLSGSGRYVRVYGTRRGTEWGYSLWDMEVYGSPGDHNQLPTVALTSPGDGATYTAPASVNVSADAADSDGSIAKVDFFLNGAVAATATGAPYSATLTDLGVGSFTIWAVATDNAGGTARSASATIAVGAPTGGTLPPPWVDETVGVQQVGGASYGSGVFSVTGYGDDIWGTRDEFEYVHQTLSGDATLVARVTSVQDTNPFAKAGVMWRETQDVDSSTVLLDARPDGSIEFMARTTAGINMTFVAGGIHVLPMWLKLARTGPTFAGFVSSDGSAWQPIGAVTLPFPQTQAMWGLAVTSHVTGVPNTSAFDHVQATAGSQPQGLAAPWSDADIGAAGLSGSAAWDGTTFTVQGAGADIWGSTDAFHFVFQPLSADGEVLARVASEQNTDTFAKAGVMIRQSLTATSAHVILDVRPEGSIEFMTRAADGDQTQFLAGDSQAFPVWLKLARTGSIVTASVSGDGSTWRTVGSTTVAFPATTSVGLVVTSHTTSTLNTSTFDGVAVSTASP